LKAGRGISSPVPGPRFSEKMGGAGKVRGGCVKEHFVRLKVGLLEHIEDSRVTPTMMNVYVIVLWQADYETGFWKGSAAKIFAAWGGQLSLRTIQRALEALCREGYLKSFHQPGQRHNYPVAINKYLIKSGKHKGYWLNASDTTVPECPVYELADDENTADTSDPTPDSATDCVIDRDTTASSTASPVARILDSRELEKEFRGSQSQSPDAGLPASTRSKATAKSKAKSKHSVDGRLKANLAEKIADAGNGLSFSMAPLGLKPFLEDEQRAAFEELEYTPDLDSPLLTTHFIDAVVDVVADNFFHERCPANLCSEVIDRCQEQIENGEPAYWPPDFEKHRDRLRKDQHEAERKQRAAAA